MYKEMSSGHDSSVLTVIAVILAVFLHHGNGRAITSTSNDNIERMLGLVEEELNTVLNETNEKPTAREENPADVLRLSEPDSSSHEALQFEFSDDVSGESINEASPALVRQKRSRSCYTGNEQTVKLASGILRRFPICEKISFTGCGSSIAKFNVRKCVESDFEAVIVSLMNGTNKTRLIPTTCSCAA